MATESADGLHAAQNSLNIRHRLDGGLLSFFEMPPLGRPTLPELLLIQTGIRSWFLASVAAGAGLYGVFLILAVLDGNTLAALIQAGSWAWRNSLLLPVMIIYLLLIQPPLRRLLINAVNSFLPLLPTAKRSEHLVSTAYFLNRWREWLAIIIGIICGWLLDPPLNKPYLAPKVYSLLGEALLYGLIGWSIYSGLIRTRILATLHGQAQELNIIGQPAPTGPLMRWSLALAGSLLGGILLSALFIEPGDLGDQTTIIIYSVITLAATLVLIFSKVPRSLLTQITVFRAAFLFLLLAGVGTIGFNYFEGWDLNDAFYATIITMTTVGYGDLSPKTDSGRIFTIVLSLVAIGIGGYAVSSIAAFIVEGNFNRIIRGKKIYKQIDRLDKHIILCGSGRVGQQIAFEFYKTGTPFVVIEQNPNVLEVLLRQVDIPYIQGDATQDKILELAGIERARGLITTFSDDKDNAFVILSARELGHRFGNTALRTISRVDDERHKKKLENAGADQTISPNAIGGQRMVSVMLHPEVVTFLDEMLQAEQQTGQILRLEEVHVDQIRNSILVDLLERDELRVIDIGQRTGLLVVVIKPGSVEEADPYLYAPTGDTRLQRGDILIVIGTPEERAKLNVEAAPAMVEVWLSKTSEALNTWLDKIALGS